MKTFIPLLLLLLSLPCFLQAQLQKGTVSPNVVANIDQYWAGDEGVDGFSLNLGPSISYFVNDNLMLGTGVSFSLFSSEGNTNTLTVLTPGFRYYFGSPSTGNRFFAGGSATLALSDDIGSFYRINTGYTSFLNENIALEGILAYQIMEDGIPNQLLLTLNLKPFMDRDDRDNWRSVSSAFQRGDLLVGTGIAQITYIDENAILSMSPSVVFFLNDRLAVGGNLGGSFDLTNSGNNFNNSFFGAGLLGRLYFDGEAQRSKWFAELGANFSASRSHFSDVFESKSNRTTANALLGKSIFLTQFLAIEPYLGISYGFGTNVKIEYDNPTPVQSNLDRQLEDNTFQLGVGVRVQYFLKKK